MAWWTLAMLAYPETQARAHAELDAVVGRARLPTFADLTHLPYIRAMVKEALRWRPAAPLGAPHRSTEDGWYEGMFIPKGTLCIANLWHMNRDPEIYGKNTEDFDPGRHLDANGYLGSGVPDVNLKEHGNFTFGFGRRNCVGRYMADNALFINIAVILWATKFERKKDATGHYLPLNLDGWVDVGLVALVGFITYSYMEANVGISADVQSRSNSRLLRASRRLLRCLHRSVSCGGYEYEVTWDIYNGEGSGYL
jgi:cytochrome P450